MNDPIDESAPYKLLITVCSVEVDCAPVESVALAACKEIKADCKSFTSVVLESDVVAVVGGVEVGVICPIVLVPVGHAVKEQLGPTRPTVVPSGHTIASCAHAVVVGLLRDVISALRLDETGLVGVIGSGVEGRGVGGSGASGAGVLVTEALEGLLSAALNTCPSCMPIMSPNIMPIWPPKRPVSPDEMVGVFGPV